MTRPPKVTRPRGGYDEKKKFVKKTYRKVYVADQDPDGPEPEDEDLEEELEGEAEELQEALIQDHDLEDPEELRAIDEEGDSDGNEEEVQEELREAYTAGWREKAGMNDKKKSRGWSAGSSQSTLPPSVAQKKQASHCASCGQKGHAPLARFSGKIWPTAQLLCLRGEAIAMLKMPLSMQMVVVGK